MEPIISLHLPKTAGSSFAKALDKHFGNTLLLDYDDYPINTPTYERNRDALLSSLRLAEQGIPGIQCVHGHFLPIKYLLLNAKQKLFFATWMRDPVERMVSHYYYWQKIYDPKTTFLPQHKRVVEEGWSLERFCLSPEFRNLYSQYLWGFPLEMFDFIGIAEFYEDDLTYFSYKYLDGSLDAFKVNVGDRVGSEISPVLRRKIESYHEKDVCLYNRAIQMRRLRGVFAD